MHQTELTNSLSELFASAEAVTAGKDMPCLTLHAANLLATMQLLKDSKEVAFDMLMDITAVDYMHYGIDDWRKNNVSSSGFMRAKQLAAAMPSSDWDKPRFAVVYHLLSIVHNHRLRVKVYLEEDDLQLSSVVSIWPASNWFEREVFDLFGIQFENHPDLRRLLTDYGFKGHPFRKDFPLEGHVEMHYDAEKKRCVYRPVSIKPRVNIPKVIRTDARYISDEGVPKKEPSDD